MRALLLGTSLLLGCAAALPAQRPVRTPAGAPQRPAAPEPVVATPGADGHVVVSWTPVSGATAYDLGRLVAPGGWQRVGRVAGGDTSYIDRGRDLTQSHRYRVVAIVGNLASLPALSNELTEPAAGATGGGATPSSATSPTPSSDTARVTTAARCSTHGSAPGRQFCSSDRIDWGPTLSKDIFITASCPEGYALVTGGHDTLLWGSSELRSSGPSGNGWQLWVQARSDPNRPAMSFARATALCERR